jgi:hypothetical protein
VLNQNISGNHGYYWYLRTAQPARGARQNLLSCQKSVLLRSKRALKPLIDSSLAVKFNPSPKDLLQQVGPKIAFVHIGKAAGTSIQKALSRYLGDTQISLYEYHCYNCNKRLAELICSPNFGLDVSFVIPVRDPLERWISAWNWEFSRMSVNHDFLDSHPRIRQSLSLFASCPSHIDALLDGDDDAILLARYGHLRMGHSWYLPPAVARMIKASQINIITMDHLERDTLATINRIRREYGYETYGSIDLPNEKTNYKSSFPDFCFAKIEALSSRQTNFMRNEFLVPDYRAINSLFLQL